MMKLLIILGIVVLLVIGVLFVPPIYNRFTKPFFKNTVDAKEWYHQVDCENLTQVRDYCDRRGYSMDIFQEKTDIDLCKIQINSIIQHSIVP